MRIAVDIDSTLHHYWDVLSDSARRRFGIELPYEEQLEWGITRLKPHQLAVVIADSHSDEAILAGRPYPDAVETVRAWREQGHFIQVTSQRDDACRAATATWLERIGLPYDELHCSSDKLAHALASEIELLIDDNPTDLRRALDAGLLAATILHPWNRDVCDEEDVVCGRDWSELRRRLEPALSRR